jgi:hypothetical protein
MKKSPTPVPYKTIFQVRYKPELKFYDLLMPAVQQQKDYPHWWTDRMSVTLGDVEQHCNLTVNHQSFTYEQDSHDMGMEAKHVGEAVSGLPGALQLTSFSFFGYRCFSLVSSEMSFEELVSVLNVKLFCQDENLRRILPKRVDDLLYRVDFLDLPNRYHLTIGALWREQVPQFIQFNRNYHLPPQNAEEEYQKIKAKYPNVSLLLDIDLCQMSEDLSLDDLNSFTTQAPQKVRALTKSLAEYLLEQ